MKKETYVYKWEFKFDSKYKITTNKEIVNTETNRVLKLCMNNKSLGYWFGRRFIAKSKLNSNVKSIKQKTYSIPHLFIN